MRTFGFPGSLQSPSEKVLGALGLECPDNRSARFQDSFASAASSDVLLAGVWLWAKWSVFFDFL